MYTKSLEQEIADNLAKEISKEIDNGIMLSLLVGSGWVEVKFSYRDTNHEVDVMSWVENHCKKKQWMRLNNSFAFSKNEEAEWFILRWA